MLGRRIETTAVRKGGKEFPIELAITRIAPEGPPQFTAYLREISEANAMRRSWPVRSRCWNCWCKADRFPTCSMRCAKSFRSKANISSSPRCCSWTRIAAAFAPSPVGVPDDYSRVVDGIQIGPGVGSCGTAATGANLSSSRTLPRIRCGRISAIWRLSHGLRACWSTPIFSSQSKVLGTFAVYSATPRSPSKDELRLVDILTRTAGIAIERRRDEEAIKESDRRKDEFLATLAHELRNPLAPMRNALQVIQLAGNNAAAVGQAREMMERQMRHMVRLVDDLLDVSRITRANWSCETARRVGDRAPHRRRDEPSANRSRGHELTIAMPPQPIFVDADPVRLAQVYSNLLNNAAKYTERGGKIWLTAERQGSDAVVSVRGTGVGIPREMLTKVFELFTQVDRTLEKAQGGLGIGLTLVRRLTEMHDGRVEVESGVMVTAASLLSVCQLYWLLLSGTRGPLLRRLAQALDAAFSSWTTIGTPPSAWG